jgi:hypothetical protein
MLKMTSAPEPAPAAPTKTSEAAERTLAAGLTAIIVLLQLYFLGRAGGLFRDEVNSLNLARGGWSQMTHDSFPVLFPILLRAWSGLGLANTDLALRSLGALVGLSLTAAFWLAARWLRQKPPLWSLLLVGLNAWMIYYGAWLRAYGLGSAMIALCAAAAWVFLEKPRLKTWLLFAVTATLSVQALYQNATLVAAVCAGGGAVCARRKDLKTAGGIFLGGLAAAVSLLPYWSIIFGMPQAASPLRMDFDPVIAYNDLNTVLAYPLAQFFWVWCGLAALILVRGLAGCFPAWRDDRSLYAAVTLIAGAGAFMAFLRAANFPVQPWYFLPLVALAAVMLEAALPRLTGKFRALLWGGVVATALISTAFGVRVLDYRYTNVDQLAKRLNSLAGKNDLVVVAPWQFGITFGHYFANACAWTSLPPIADHGGERYDLLLAQMQNTNAMVPLLAAVSQTLRSGHTVWVAGDLVKVEGDTLPTSPLPPPLPHTSWNETPYRFTWYNQLGWFMGRHSTDIQCLDAGTNEDVNELERLPLFKATWWKD